MKRQTLVNGLLSLTAVTLMTGCVDDKYDLSNIDTTTQIKVDNLTVPVNLSEIKLENVVDLDDNDLIEKVIIDGRECYSIVEGGTIAPTSFSIGQVHVAAPHIDGTNIHVGLSGLPIPPGTPITIPVDYDVDLFGSSDPTLVDYNFAMSDVHEALKVLKNVKTVNPIEIKVVLTVPSELLGNDNTVTFNDLELQLPWGMMVEPSADYTYSTVNEDGTLKGILKVDRLAVGSNGEAVLAIKATGLDLGVEKGTVVNGHLGISGQVGVLKGKLGLHLKGITLPSSIDITANYYVSSFDIASFSGKIDYNMDAIHIDPISLNDLPDFLDNPNTNIIIANPQIIVKITNPVGKWLKGTGSISLVSNFKDGSSVDNTSAGFTLEGKNTTLAFCTPEAGATFVQFDGLRNVLSNGVSGLPSSIEVNIKDINFAGDVDDFPLGDLGDAEGSYDFKAPLGFGKGSMIVYETTEDGWSSEDLENVNIKKVYLEANCTTNLPVSVSLKVYPVDKYGNDISVVEVSEFSVPANAQNQPVELYIQAKEGTTITDLDGVRFVATVSQDNEDTEAIGPDLTILLKDLRVTVDGYFEKEL